MLTIAAGVALGIILAFAFIYTALRWWPKLISLNRVKIMLVTMLMVTVALLLVQALIRAELVREAAVSASHQLSYYEKRGQTAYAPRLDRALLATAFRRANIVGSTLAEISFADPGPIDRKHDPFDVIKDTIFESRFIQDFVPARNADHTRAIMLHLEQGRLTDERVIRQGRETALGALFLAALLDLPTLLLGVLAYGTVQRWWPVTIAPVIGE